MQKKPAKAVSCTAVHSGKKVGGMGAAVSDAEGSDYKGAGFLLSDLGEGRNRFKDKLYDDVSSRGCKLVARGGREFCVLGTVLSASHSELTLFSQ